MFGQQRFGEVAKLDVVQQDAPLLRLVHAREQPQQGGLARPHWPQHAYFFSGADVQLGHYQRLAASVAGGHALKAVLTAQGVHHNRLLLAMVVVLQGPQAVQPLERGLGLRPLHQLARDHRYRGQHPARQDGAGNQPTHGQFAPAHQQGTGSNHQGVRDLLQRTGQVLRMLADVAHLQVQLARLVGGFHPARQHAPAALAGLDGLGPLHRLHQQPRFLVAGGIGLAGKGVHTAPVVKAHAEADHKKCQWNQGQRAGNQANDQHKKQRKGCIHHQVGGHGGEEAAHRLITAHLGSQTAHALRQLVQPD